MNADRPEGTWLGGWRVYIILAVLTCFLFLPGLKRLPTTDRDEARFAQASKQMLETGNFVDIRFQSRPRYKKPIGIYWLQAASASVAGPSKRREIWPYRLPSFLGALLAVLLTFFVGQTLFCLEAGFVGALLLSSTILLQVEARIATTDAFLLCCIVAMQGSLGHIYLKGGRGKTWVASLLFWISCGVGILIKGPIPFLVAGLTVITLLSLERDWTLIRRLHPLVGVGVLFLMVAPWFWAIQQASGGQFVKKALFTDVIPKLLGGQESHGAPPGLYLVLFPILFWPGSLMAFRGLGLGWRHRNDRTVRFLMAWMVPTWLAFELIPTKLPHYILPVFPAVALLAGAMVAGIFPEKKEALRGERQVFSIFLKVVFYGVTGILGVGILGLDIYFSRRIRLVDFLVAAGVAGVAWLSVQWDREGKARDAVFTFLVGVALVIIPTFTSVLPSASPLWISRRVARVVASLHLPPDAVLASVGYHEPSLVFGLGTKTRLVEVPEAISALKNHSVALVLVTQKHKAALIRDAKRQGLDLKSVVTFRGFNYSKGKWLTLTLFAPAGAIPEILKPEPFYRKRTHVKILPNGRT